MDIATIIRQSLAASHSAIEATPLSRALVQGTITRGPYLELLGQLWLVHAELEERLAQSPYAGTLYQPSMARTACLEADIAALDGTDPALPRAETAHLLATIQDADPVALLGMLYVFEGSRMGSMYLARSIAKGLQVPLELGHGLDYHMVGMTTRPGTWQQFRTDFNALPLTDAERETVVATAVQTMDALLALYTAIGAPAHVVEAAQ